MDWKYWGVLLSIMVCSVKFAYEWGGAFITPPAWNSVIYPFIATMQIRRSAVAHSKSGDQGRFLCAVSGVVSVVLLSYSINFNKGSFYNADMWNVTSDPVKLGYLGLAYNITSAPEGYTRHSFDVYMVMAYILPLALSVTALLLLWFVGGGEDTVLSEEEQGYSRFVNPKFWLAMVIFVSFVFDMVSDFGGYPLDLKVKSPFAFSLIFALYEWKGGAGETRYVANTTAEEFLHFLSIVMLFLALLYDFDTLRSGSSVKVGEELRLNGFVYSYEWINENREEDIFVYTKATMYIVVSIVHLVAFGAGHMLEMDSKRVTNKLLGIFASFQKLFQYNRVAT